MKFEHPSRDAARGLAYVRDILFLRQIEAMRAVLAACQHYATAFVRDYSGVTEWGAMPYFDGHGISSGGGGGGSSGGGEGSSHALSSSSPTGFEAALLDSGSAELHQYVRACYRSTLAGTVASATRVLAATLLEPLGLDPTALAREYWAMTESVPSFGELMDRAVTASGCTSSSKRNAVLRQTADTLERSSECRRKALEFAREEAAASTARAVARWAQLQLNRFQWIHVSISTVHRRV